MNYDIVCFLHLRWNFVYQRPQHLLSRFGKYQRVFIIEEPLFDAPFAYHQIDKDPDSGVNVITPHIPAGLLPQEIVHAQKTLLDLLLSSENIEQYILWYYSPMALTYSHHLLPKLIVYDCMDELSAFKFAPAELKQNEARLLKMADIVFTGGHHLYEAKRGLHHNIHPVPSSIDKQHFARARKKIKDPQDQENIARPRIGFYGVIDERFNLELLNDISDRKPGWHFIVLGPVVKIDPATLPRKENIHYLGGKDYKQLPDYLANWDIAMMPFALNESTKYISPTKTPEFLAAGKQVISTSIRDVVIPYGKNKLVHIADTAEEFIAAAEAIQMNVNDIAWLERVDLFLKTISWDNTWQFMNAMIERTLERKKIINKKNTEVYV